MGLAGRQICNIEIGLRHGMKLVQRREASVEAMVAAVCTENLVRVDDVTESPKLAG
jgi:hypothetical protein